MELPNRNYRHSDAEMLTVCATLTEAAIAHKAFLQTRRSNWADPYFEELKQRIAAIAATHLGADNAKAMRNATMQITALQKQALVDLSDFKVQVDVDYAKDKSRQKELLKQLGFADHLKQAQRFDQQALVQLLYAFKAAMLPPVKAEMVSKGIMPALIDQITSYADVLQKANVDQEFNKSGRKVLTADGILACNQIYEEVMGVGKMAAAFMRDKPAAQSSFVFAKVASNMRGGVRSVIDKDNVETAL
ncbi:MAG: hypothetical protein ACOH2A_11430 [Sphingobacteriaceae bacterium]